MQPHVRRFVERAVTFQPCPECEGTRLTQEALSSKIEGKNIADLCEMQISDLADWVRELEEPSVAPLLKGLQHLLDSFAEIGLGYLSLDRPAGTLSGGEAQRTKMIRHLGSVADRRHLRLRRADHRAAPARHRADEPAAPAAARQGQHRARRRAQARDDRDRRPRRRPRARRGCGRRGDLLRGRRRRPPRERHGHRQAPRRPRPAQGVRTPGDVGSWRCKDASTHNLKDVSVDIPLGMLCVVTGVAGSGKSSLIHGSVAGRDGVIVIDQGAIKGSRRSNPATYTGLLEPIRKAFAKANDVKPALFSSNSEGACPTCNGAGRDLHRARRDGHGGVALRGVRGQAASRPRCSSTPWAARTSPRCWRCRSTEAETFFSDGEAKIPAAHKILERLARRGPGLPHPRPAAHHAVGRRAPAAQAGHPDGGEGRRLRPRRADHRPPPRRRARTCSACSTGSSTPASR